MADKKMTLEEYITYCETHVDSNEVYNDLAPEEEQLTYAKAHQEFADTLREEGFATEAKFPYMWDRLWDDYKPLG